MFVYFSLLLGAAFVGNSRKINNVILEATSLRGGSNRTAPFLLQSRIYRAYGLTPDLKMRDGSDFHIIPEILSNFGYSQYIST